MAYTAKRKLSGKPLVDETLDLFQKYGSKRDNWAKHAKEDKEFRLGRQWTQEQEDILKARGQAPVVVNRVHPAVEAAKSMMSANRPSFRVAPREDSDNKVAQVMSAMLAYMYDISDGRTAVRQMIDDYYVMGLGYIHVYQDPMMDMGKGEVCIHDVDPLDVYVDPNSRDRFFNDAENIIISRLFTREQAANLYPMYEKAIKNAANNAGDYDHDRPETGRANDMSTHFPEDVDRTDNTEYLRGYERYYKIMVERYRVYEIWSKKELLLNEDEYANYVQQQAYIINGEIIDDPAQAKVILSQLEQQRQQYQTQMESGMTGMGLDGNAEIPMAPEPINVEEVSFAELIERQLIQTVVTQIKRVKMCVIMGDKHLYSRELPIEDYPIVPFMSLHTRTPYPQSDVRMIKGLQEYINKMRSLIVAHATTSTNTKILVPEGSVDMSEFEQKWAQPGVAIPYDPTDGAPMPVQPSPLPNELYSGEQVAKQDIDHQLGLYEMMMGNAQAAPQTYKATISLDEFGQRKIKSKLADIEAGLTKVGQIAIPLMQQLYTQEKVFRVIQPNNSLSEFVVNKKLIDDKTNEITTFNDITVGKYDVIYLSGSTLPSNRYAELEFYMDAYQKGLVDRIEVLKKTEVFDMEGVVERTDQVGQLQTQLQQAVDEIKKLKGDLQTRDRESINLRKRIEVEKFKTELDQVSNKAKAASSVYEKRLDDNMAVIKRDIAGSIKTEASTPVSGEQGKPKVSKKK
jgi:regulator of replication initiation timing